MSNFSLHVTAKVDYTFGANVYAFALETPAPITADIKEFAKTHGPPGVVEMTRVNDQDNYAIGPYGRPVNIVPVECTLTHIYGDITATSVSQNATTASTYKVYVVSVLDVDGPGERANVPRIVSIHPSENNGYTISNSYILSNLDIVKYFIFVVPDYTNPQIIQSFIRFYVNNKEEAQNMILNNGDYKLFDPPLPKGTRYDIPSLTITHAFMEQSDYYNIALINETMSSFMLCFVYMDTNDLFNVQVYPYIRDGIEDLSPCKYPYRPSGPTNICRGPGYNDHIYYNYETENIFPADITKPHLSLVMPSNQVFFMIPFDVKLHIFSPPTNPIRIYFVDVNYDTTILRLVHYKAHDSVAIYTQFQTSTVGTLGVHFIGPSEALLSGALLDYVTLTFETVEDVKNNAPLNNDYNNLNDFGDTFNVYNVIGILESLNRMNIDFVRYNQYNLFTISSLPGVSSSSGAISLRYHTDIYMRIPTTSLTLTAGSVFTTETLYFYQHFGVSVSACWIEYDSAILEFLGATTIDQTLSMFLGTVQPIRGFGGRDWLTFAILPNKTNLTDHEYVQPAFNLNWRVRDDVPPGRYPVLMNTNIEMIGPGGQSREVRMGTFNIPADLRYGVFRSFDDARDHTVGEIEIQ